MKYLFIIPQYHAKGHSSNINTLMFLDALKTKGHDITILSLDNQKLEYPATEIVDGVKVISLIDSRDKGTLKLGKGKSYKELNPIFKAYIKYSSYLKRMFKNKTEEWPIDAVSYGLIRKYLDKEYDAIISTSHPFVSHVIASYLKRKGYAKKWVAFVWDPYVYNYTLSTKGIKQRKSTVLKAFNNVDRVYYLKGILGKNHKEGFYLSNKETENEIVLPSLRKREVIAPLNNTVPTLLYAGTFYEDIRNPEEMFKVLLKIDSEFFMSIFYFGCQDIIDKYHQEFKGRIVTNPIVDKEEIHRLESESSILINLGNSITNQLPGKTFELISSGKPIINFYFTEEDPALEYFRKYPICFSFNLNKYTDKDILDLEKFIKENINTNISFEEATKKLQSERSEAVISKVIENLEK